MRVIYEIGDEVRVVKCADETVSKHYVGMRGVVVKICPVGDIGQTEESPYYVVEFSRVVKGGMLYHHQNGFWCEELAIDGKEREV